MILATMDSSNITAGGAIEDVSKLTKLINENGPSIVILSIFLLLFGVIMYVTLKNNNKYIETTMKQNADLINRLLNSMPAKNYNEEDIVEIFTKLNEVFKEECKKIGEKTNAGRTSIYVFHNGSVASHGLPFFKMTCVSEWIGRGSGFQELVSKHTNINLALFSSLVEELYNNGEYTITKLNNEEMEPYTYAFMNERAKTSMFMCVYDSNNRIMAFINAEFKNALTDSELERVKNLMRNACAKVQPVLEFSSYKNKTYN